MNIVRRLQSLSLISVYLSAALAPIFFLPFTTEPFELNKQYLLVLLVSLGLLAWLGAGWLNRKIIVRRSPLDLPLLFFWLAALAATLFSKGRVLSLLGPLDNLAWGLVSITAFLLLYFLIVQNIQTDRQFGALLRLIGISGFLAASYYLLRFVWTSGADGLLPRWNTMAASGGLFAVSLLPAFFLGVTNIFNRANSVRAFSLWSVATAITFTAMIGVKRQIIWLAAAAGLGFFLAAELFLLRNIRSVGRILLAGLFAIAVLFWSLDLSRFIAPASFPVDISLSPKTSWQITSQTLKEGAIRFLLGGGPGTFVYSFSAYRPVELNQTIARALRFRRPSSGAFELLAGMGVLGFLAFLVIPVVLLGRVGVVWRRRLSDTRSHFPLWRGPDSQSQDSFFGVTAAWLSLAITFFLVDFRLAQWILFFVFSALLAVAVSFKIAAQPVVFSLSLQRRPVVASVTAAAILIITGLIIGNFFLGRFYLADVAAAAARHSAELRDYEGANKLLVRAGELNPYRAEYAIGTAQAFLVLAARESREESPNALTVANHLTQAVDAARRATALSPQSAAAWETLAMTYANAQAAAPDANRWAIKAWSRAIELEGTNSLFYLERGIAYQRAKMIDLAKNDLAKAIALNPNDARPHIALALLFEAEKEFSRALDEALIAGKISSNNPGIIYLAGRLYFNRDNKGDTAKAEAAFRQTILLEPNHANALFSLGLLLERAGKVSEALENYRKVQKLNPENKEVARRIQTLHKK